MELDTADKLIDSHPACSGGDDFDSIIRAWLATGGVELAPGEGSSCTLVSMYVDYDMDLQIFAIPNETLDDQAHRDLAAVSGKCFAFHFAADIPPEAYAGAMRMFGGSAEEIDVFEEQVDDMRGDMEMDWDALLAGAGAWRKYEVSSGATLPGPITHSYTARIAM